MDPLSEEQKENLTYFASLLYSDALLAEILEISPDIFRRQMKAKSGEIYRTVAGARIKSESSIRDGIIKMASRGSTPAQTMAMDLLKGLKKNNV